MQFAGGVTYRHPHIFICYSYIANARILDATRNIDGIVQKYNPSRKSKDAYS
jgi:hypothetical protein